VLPESKPIRVLVVDDHPGVRRALRQLLSIVEDIEVVGLAVDGAHAVALAGSLDPDVVLMDISMPILDGIEATRRIATQNPRSGVVTLTTFRTSAEEAHRAGAAAHMLKDAPPEQLIGCIRSVAAGQPRPCPGM
jgi:DNA-binding NarL/FixJ family response regulator